MEAGTGNGDIGNWLASASNASISSAFSTANADKRHASIYAEQSRDGNKLALWTS